METSIETKFMLLMTGINTRERQKLALTLANALRLRGIMTVFALGKNSIFTKIFAEKGYEAIEMPIFPEARDFISSIKRKIKLNSFSQEAAKLLEIKSIDAVLSLGGMSAYPILEVASKMSAKQIFDAASKMSARQFLSASSKTSRVRILLVEPNAVVSKCNADFMKKAARIYFPYEEMQQGIDYELYQKSTALGIPVDKDILRAEPADIQTNKKKLLVLTCKVDPKNYNALIRDLVLKYPEIARDFYIIHETGDKEIAAMQRFYETNKISATCDMFFDNRGAYCKVADIVIARPNSDIISELSALCKPAIYIPLPEDRDPYQKANAVMAAKKGMGYLVEDIKSSNPGIRLRKIYSFLSSFQRGDEILRKVSEELNFENSAVRMADDIEKVLKSGK